jgi:nicotinate dehydrogenase subunit B
MNALRRREFIKAGGALVIGFGLRDALAAQSTTGLQPRGALAGPPDAKQIDTWLAIHADNTATVYVGFAELGQGASTALLQIAADELDLDMSQIKSVGLDTNVTPNQGGTYSSASIARGGPQVRQAAAEARRALLGMASKRLNVPPDSFSISKGVLSTADGSQHVTYGELIGDRRFDLPFSDTASVKRPADYKVVGTRVARRDLPDKVGGRHLYMQYVRVPGMLHGRVVRPRGQRAYGVGAKLASVDETSIRAIPGARVVRRSDFLGVIAENEWDAVRAARQLKVTWEPTSDLPGHEKVYERMRAAKTNEEIVIARGDVAGAMTTTAAHVVTQVGRAPYQAHAPFGPNCAVADVRRDAALVMCSTQDVYATRRTLATLLKLPQESVRVQYYEGSGTYGHSCYDDVAQAAAFMSQEAAKPVRVQFMRWDEHGWDNFGPAHVGEARAAVDGNGKLVAYEYHGWQHGWSGTEASAQLAGSPVGEFIAAPAMGVQGVNRLTCGGQYQIANLKLVNHKLPVTEYLKAGWLRSPLDLSFAFVSEQAIDQLARQLKIDPYEFRKRNIADERWLGVLEAAAKAARWIPGARTVVEDSDVLVGRGIGLGTHLQSWGGAVADIEVNPHTGSVAIKHLYGALDAGLVVNPAIVESQIRGQLVQTASRMLHEEVTFDTAGVTSVDWSTYPILRFEECPEVTPIVVQRINERSLGAGEEVMAAAAAAIANAFFDATGVRMEQFPFTKPRVLAALKKA